VSANKFHTKNVYIYICISSAISRSTCEDMTEILLKVALNTISLQEVQTTADNGKHKHNEMDEDSYVNI
jgi:hypothetical protein